MSAWSGEQKVERSGVAAMRADIGVPRSVGEGPGPHTRKRTFADQVATHMALDLHGSERAKQW